MLVQSSSGKVYAVLARNPEYELGVLPQIQIMSTTVFLLVRCRYKSLLTDYFDPMLVPKTVLVGGIERSKNTLRGTVVLNTGFTIDKIGSGFAALMGEKLAKEADGFLLANPDQPGECLYNHDKRDDFEGDFAQLVKGIMDPIYPPKDFSLAPNLMTGFDLAMFAETAGTLLKSGFQAMDGGKEPESNVKKLILGGDDEPAPPGAQADNGGLDKGQNAPDAGGKIKLFGKAPPSPTDAPIDH